MEIQPSHVSSQSPSVSPKLSGVSELIKSAWHRYTRLFSRLFPALVIAFVGLVITTFGSVAGHSFVTFILNVLGIVVVLFVYVVIGRILSETENDSHDVTGSFSRSAQFFLPYLWLVIITALITIGSFTLVIIPGLIVSVFVSVAFYCFLLNGRRGTDALIASWSLVEGRWWKVFFRLLVLIVLFVILAGVISIILSLFRSGTGATPSLGIQLVQDLVSSLLIIPFALSYIYSLYVSLKETKLAGNEASSAARIWLTAFLVIGIIIIVGAFFLNIIF